MWLLLAFVSALCLGFYDIFKKISVNRNNVLIVLLLNTVFGTLFMSPVIFSNLAHHTIGLNGTLYGHLQIVLKAVIVLSSWILGYFAIKHLPLTIQGPINASRPVIVLVGALVIFGERLNWVQWIGILLGFTSLYFISRIGSKEGFPLRHSRWLWFSIGATMLGAVSALYDKYLLQSYKPLEVQAWYSLYQMIIMSVIVAVILRLSHHKSTNTSATAAENEATASENNTYENHMPEKFHWRWSIPLISLFLTIADVAYFYSLSMDGSMISIVSMVRRGSVIVSFLYGVMILHEKNIRAKLVDLSILLVSLLLLVIGANI